jgi:hypothetical protein
LRRTPIADALVGRTDFALTAQAVNLAEMVVVGNGEQRLGNITGAVTNVTAEEFNTGRVVTPTELIQRTRSRAYKSWRTTSRVGAPRSGFAVHRRPPRAMTEVHAEFFEDHRPTRSTVAVASLPRGRGWRSRPSRRCHSYIFVLRLHQTAQFRIPPLDDAKSRRNIGLNAVTG